MQTLRQVVAVATVLSLTWVAAAQPAQPGADRTDRVAPGGRARIAPHMGPAPTPAPTAEVPVADTTPPATAPAPADSASASATPARPVVDPDTVRVALMDGSHITGKLAASEITIDTQFGKLTVPVRAIRSITPGTDNHPEVKARVAELIEKLGSSQFDEREAAKAALLAMGPAQKSQLSKFANDADTERRDRVRSILEEWDSLTSDDEDPANRTPQAVAHDSVETTEFTIVGRILQPSFEVTSNYGTLNVKLSDIRRVQRFVPDAEPAETARTVQVDGNNTTRNWKQTPITLQKGDSVTISADGTITLTPWGTNAMVTPEGSTNYGWFTPNQIPHGALVGRIGNNGPVFKIGSRSTFTADRAGVLNLGIGIQPGYEGNAFPGTFNAKIRVKKKGA